MTTITELPVAAQALVDFYEQAVAAVHAKSEALGDASAKGASFISDLQGRHPEAVAAAEQVAAQINAMEDAEAQAVLAYLVTRNRDIANIATTYIKEHAPKVEESNVADEEKVRLWNERSIEQKKAASLLETIKLMCGVEDAAELGNLVSPLPAAKRGAGPGVKRGKMGRRLPAGIHWTVAGEEIGEADTKKVASVIGVKVAELRIHLENEFPESLPQVFETNLNDKVVRGIVGEPTSPVVDDDDDDDLNFDDED